MKTIKRWFAATGLILICVSITAQPERWPEQFEIPDDDRILSIKEKPFDWKNNFIIGRDLHVNRFDDQQRGLELLKECYFNWADCSNYGIQDYELCEKLGLSVIVPNPRARQMGRHLWGQDWMAMTDEEVDAFVKQWVEQSGNSKAIVGYLIIDEPGSQYFPKLAVAVAALRKYAPDKLAHLTHYPNVASLSTPERPTSQMGTTTYREYLEKFVDIVKPDMFCYGNYMVQFSMDQKERDRVAKYYTNLMDIREMKLRHNLLWVNVLTSNQVRQHTVVPTISNMMLQAYTSLASGCDGIRWYTYYQGGYDYSPINEKGQRTNTWYMLREVNRHLSILGPMIKNLKPTGVYFTDPAIDSSLPLLPGKIVMGVECSEPLMIGEFESAKGNRYMMVVNISLEHSARFVLKTNIKNERLFYVSTGEEPAYFREIITSESRGSTQVNSPERIALSKQKACWLPAGYGLLIKCSGIVDEK